MGVALVNYSTPCLFSAQTGMEQTLSFLKEHAGQLPNEVELPFQASLESCTDLLQENLKRRDTP